MTEDILQCNRCGHSFKSKKYGTLFFMIIKDDNISNNTEKTVLIICPKCSTAFNKWANVFKEETENGHVDS